jgi:hypothetical protein
MYLTRWYLILASLGGFAALALLHAAPETNEKPGRPFHAELLDIAAKYKALPRDGKGSITGEVFITPVDADIPRWAPTLCRMPEPGVDYLQAKLRTSASTDEGTHGQKLYYLYAKDKPAYLGAAEKASPVGQVLVKESWTSEEVGKDGPGSRIFKGLVSADPCIEKAGKKYIAGKLVGLYIMMKLDAKTPDTDEGWVYGTVSADGKQVTAAGRVESCMSCHVKAKHDRLFGLAKEDVQRIKSYYEKTKQGR